MNVKGWFVYILRCNDGSLYTGITTEPDRRLSEHNSGYKAAAYTRARRPVTMVYEERTNSRSEAARREIEIKRLKRSEKEKLIKRS